MSCTTPWAVGAANGRRTSSARVSACPGPSGEGRPTDYQQHGEVVVIHQGHSLYQPAEVGGDGGLGSSHPAFHLVGHCNRRYNVGDIYCLGILFWARLWVPQPGDWLRRGLARGDVHTIHRGQLLLQPRGPAIYPDHALMHR